MSWPRCSRGPTARADPAGGCRASWCWPTPQRQRRRAIAFIAMLIAAVWTLLAGASWAAFFSPDVPVFAGAVGEFLIQPLRGVTADFTVAMLQQPHPGDREACFSASPAATGRVSRAAPAALSDRLGHARRALRLPHLPLVETAALFSIAAIVVPIFANSGAPT